MQFLSDVFIRCPDCHGRRYRPHILEVKVNCQSPVVSRQSGGERLPTGCASRTANSNWSIADLLEATVDEGIRFLEHFAESKPAQRAAEKLKLLQEVGLGYLRLGQPINTLSGGESQRLKLVSHLAECSATERGASVSRANDKTSERQTQKATQSAVGRRRASSVSGKATLFLFDEPTTGLHFDDVRLLLQVFQRLVDAGHSVVVIEHNLDVIKTADWIIDLGPEAGDEGGQLVAQGTPEDIAAGTAGHTGRALRELGVGTQD